MAVVTVNVVQIPHPEMVERRAQAEERRCKRAVAGDPRTQQPRCGPKLSACQSCGSALPRMIRDHQPDGNVSREDGKYKVLALEAG